MTPKEAIAQAVRTTCRVVFADIDDPRAGEAASAIAVSLPQPEVERVRRLRRDLDRRRTLLAQHLIRVATGDPACELSRTPLGRLQLAGLGGDVSVSHSGRWVIAAYVASGSVGVDVEEVDRVSQLPEAAFLSELEVRRIGKTDSRLRFAAALWAFKEAVAKLDGRGLRLDPCRIETDWDGPSPLGLEMRAAGHEAFGVVKEGPSQGYVVAVATKPAVDEIKIIRTPLGEAFQYLAE